MSDEQLIDDLVRRVMAELGHRTQSNALVLFSGASLGFEAALAALQRAKDIVNLDWTQTSSAQKILDQDAIARLGMTKASSSLVASHDLLVVPTLTVNLAAKVAHGIGDCLASNVVAEFVMSGRTVIAAVNGCSPDADDKRAWFPQMPPAYAAMLRENLARLADFGVVLTDAAQLDQAIAGQATVARAPVSQELTLATAQQLAQAAIDKARQLGIAVAVAVVDSAGHPIVLHRMADSLLAAIELSQNKAWTAVSFKRSTADLGAASAELPGLSGRVVLFGGGEPIRCADQVLGGIGVSGGTVEEDCQIVDHALRQVWGE